MVTGERLSSVTNFRSGVSLWVCTKKKHTPVKIQRTSPPTAGYTNITPTDYPGPCLQIASKDCRQDFPNDVMMKLIPLALQCIWKQFVFVSTIVINGGGGGGGGGLPGTWPTRSAKLTIFGTD